MAEEKDWSKYYTQPYQGAQIDYNAAYRPEMDAFEAWKAQLASKVDPAMQEEQDRKLATGRAFWAGANILGNTIANIMNVNNVGKGAPSAQTYDDRAYNQMYNLWRDTDARLFAQRRHAQDKYDAANMSLAKLRSNIAKEEAAQRQAIANENAKVDRANAALKNRLDATHSQHPDWGDDDVYNYVVSDGKILPDSEVQKQRAEANEDYKERAKVQASANAAAYNTRHPQSYDIPLGGDNVLIANNEKEANIAKARLRSAVARYVSKNQEKFKRTHTELRKNEDNETVPMTYDTYIKPENINDAQQFVIDNDLMSDPEFKKILDKEMGGKFDGSSKNEAETKTEIKSPWVK